MASVSHAELGELEAFRDVWRAVPAGLEHELGFARLERGGTLAIACAAFSGVTLMNRVLGLGLAEPASDELLDELDAFFREAGAGYAIALAPAALPSGLAERLVERGFEPGYSWTKFERLVGPAAPAKSELRVERIGPERAADFALAAVEGSPLPPALLPVFEVLPGRAGWDCFVTYADAEPAGCGALFATGGVGWLGIGATRPAFRRRGSQSAVLAARLSRAQELGLNVVVSETGTRVGDRPATSHTNLERAGLEPIYVRPNLMSPEPTPSREPAPPP
jgi:GNAT superfamily N-acetyltransferase